MYHRRHGHATDGFTAADDEERWTLVHRVTWKDENEVHGEPVGPMWFDGTEWPWMTKRTAQAIARNHDAIFEEV